jgi:hypothetical protein
MAFSSCSDSPLTMAARATDDAANQQQAAKASMLGTEDADSRDADPFGR